MSEIPPASRDVIVLALKGLRHKRLASSACHAAMSVPETSNSLNLCVVCTVVFFL